MHVCLKTLTYSFSAILESRVAPLNAYQHKRHTHMHTNVHTHPPTHTHTHTHAHMHTCAQTYMHTQHFGCDADMKHTQPVSGIPMQTRKAFTFQPNQYASLAL